MHKKTTTIPAESVLQAKSRQSIDLSQRKDEDELLISFNEDDHRPSTSPLQQGRIKHHRKLSSGGCYPNRLRP